MSSDADIYEGWSIVQSQGMTYCQVKLDEATNKVIIEPGRLHYMVGNLSYQEDSTHQKSFVERVWDNLTGGINVFTKEITGTGTVVFGPPTLGNFHRHILKPGEVIYVDAGTYVASSPGLDLEGVFRGKKPLKTFIFGSEKIVHYKVTNASPNPEVLFVSADGPVMEHDLKPGESFYVDGDFGLAYADPIVFDTTVLGKSFLTWVTGEGWLSKYSNPANSEGTAKFLYSPVPTTLMQVIRRLENTIHKEAETTRKRSRIFPVHKSSFVGSEHGVACGNDDKLRLAEKVVKLSGLST